MPQYVLHVAITRIHHPFDVMPRCWSAEVCLRAKGDGDDNIACGEARSRGDMTRLLESLRQV